MMKNFIKKIIYREKYDSETYIKFLKSQGIEIGDDVTIYSPVKTVIDLQYPWMISIGNHVRITEGVVILTHDYSWSVLKRMQDDDKDSGAILGASGCVSIGNNVFIGMNTIILRNVKIEDNVIIGVGSVVTKDCESGYIYAGNPAKKIMSINEYFMKRKNAQLTEAKELAMNYYKRYNKIPPKEVFHEYFMLFNKTEELEPVFINKMELCGNYSDSLDYLKSGKLYYDTYENFITECLKI